jgi:hypothetical protein
MVFEKPSTNRYIILSNHAILKNLFSGREHVFMKASKEKTVVASRHAKRRLENPLTEVQKVRKVAAEAERQRWIQWTTDEKYERLRAMAERRCAAGVEELAAEATRKSSRQK